MQLWGFCFYWIRLRNKKKCADSRHFPPSQHTVNFTKFKIIYKIRTTFWLASFFLKFNLSTISISWLTGRLVADLILELVPCLFSLCCSDRTKYRWLKPLLATSKEIVSYTISFNKACGRQCTWHFCCLHPKSQLWGRPEWASRKSPTCCQHFGPNISFCSVCVNKEPSQCQAPWLPQRIKTDKRTHTGLEGGDWHNSENHRLN